MKQLLDILGCSILHLMSDCFRRLSLERTLRVGRFLGTCAFYLSPRRHVAYADIKAALGDGLREKEIWQIVRRHFSHLGEVFVEVLRVPSFGPSDIEKNIHIHHAERFYGVVNESKGAMLVTAHFGNWELLQIVSGLLGKPIYVLAREQKLNRMNEYLNELRQTHGSVAIGRGIGVRDLLRALRRKELVGMLGDQDASKTGGLILPLFGRKTTVPTGAFELAQRSGVPVLPAFIARRNGPHHDIYVEEPIHCEPGGNPAAEIEKGVRSYVNLMENYIRKFPDQWLWETKRWKYSWTKRILILSDGKPGHVKQSEAIAARFKNIQKQYNRPGMEYPTSVLEVRFKSEWHRKIFPLFAFFMIPWAQGRLGWLHRFFDPETQKTIEKVSTDFVISAGASLAGLNLYLAKDSRAKSIILMKPSFPFNLFHYDLVIAPAHDTGIIPGRIFRTLLAPNQMDPETLKKAGEELRKKLSAPGNVKVGVFLGGPTHDFEMDLGRVEKFFSLLSKIAGQTGDYLVTTSRRTPETVSRFLKERVSRDPHCQKVVVATENNSPEVVPGMMALAEILIVTEDSISMISEAVGSGKKVLILSLGSKKLPAKHRRFIRQLIRKGAVLRAGVRDLETQMKKIQANAGSKVFQKETQALQNMLQEIL